MQDPQTPLAGQVALITGGARRLGAAIAQRYHAAGASILVHYRTSSTDAEQLLAGLNAQRPGSAVGHAADLLDVNALPGIVEAAIAAFGRLDILVNSASTFYPTPIGEITPAVFDDLVGTNFKAPLFLAQAAAPQLRLRQGLIINMVDIHGQRPLRRHPVYSSAKAALIMLTRSLARELGPQVRVNAIAPGPVLWPETGYDAALKATIVERTALKREGSAQDIVRAAFFFATEAPYVTGQILAVDGGRSLGS